MSARALRLLLIEDSEDDAALLLHELKRSGYATSHTRAESHALLGATGRPCVDKPIDLPQLYSLLEEQAARHAPAALRPS